MGTYPGYGSCRGAPKEASAPSTVMVPAGPADAAYAVSARTISRTTPTRTISFLPVSLLRPDARRPRCSRPSPGSGAPSHPWVAEAVVEAQTVERDLPAVVAAGRRESRTDSSREASIPSPCPVSGVRSGSSPVRASTRASVARFVAPQAFSAALRTRRHPPLMPWDGELHPSLRPVSETPGPAPREARFPRPRGDWPWGVASQHG